MNFSNHMCCRIQRRDFPHIGWVLDVQVCQVCGKVIDSTGDEEE